MFIAAQKTRYLVNNYKLYIWAFLIVTYGTRDRIFPFLILTHGFNIHLKLEIISEISTSHSVRQKSIVENFHENA